MSTKEIIADAKLRVRVEEFLKKELAPAGFSSMRLMETPLTTNLTLVVGHPGRVIGPGGRNIRELSDKLAAMFGLKSPQISVVELENPMLDPSVVATRIAEALERGIRYRRILRLFMRKIRDAGAIGAQIRLAGKLTSDRSRFEKYTFGYIPSAGEPGERQLRIATKSFLLPQGLLGVKVKILPPDAKFPDQVELIKPQDLKVEEGPRPEKGENDGEPEA